MTTTSSDLTLLRRAVLLDPGSDDARLVFADEIEGSGGANEQRWAEMIRAGCELAKCSPDCGVGKVCRGVDGWLPSIVTCAGLRDHEAALLRDLTPWLRRGERCTSCGGRRIVRQAVLKPFKFTIEPPRIEPSASLFDTVEVECPTCHGVGWLGSLADVPEDRATFSRGFVGRVELTAAQVQDTGFLRRLFSEWPVTEAGVVGREPEPDSSPENNSWCWTLYYTNQLEAVDRSSLTPELFAEVSLRSERTDANQRGDQWCEFPAAADAVAALSRAIVSLGREAAGLPQLEEVRT